MSCQDIADLLDNGQMLDLPPERQAAVTAHLRHCEDCASEWHALRTLAQVPSAPAPPPDLFARTMALAEGAASSPAPRAPQRRSFWLGAGVGGALAASIALAVMTLNVAPRTAGPAANGAAPAITIALNEPHDVGVAIDSVEALADAEIRVVLTGGVRLDGFSDRSVVSWRTDLDRGVNRLTLPLIAVEPGGGQVLVEVGHGSKRQVFVVNVGVDAPRDGVAGAAGTDVV